MNLSDIIQAAQGGQGVTNLANQLGIPPAQAQAAVQAMMPAFSSALQKATSDPSSLAGVVSHLASGVHLDSFTGSDPAAAAANGGAALSQIFGSSQIASQIASRAASATGVDPATVQQMMPAVASMLVGGLTHSMNAQGFGGVLSQMTTAATQTADATPSQGGMLGGLMGMLGGLLGGAQSTQGQSSLAQAGLTALTGMLQSGVSNSQPR
jgi:hypothetical protein